MPIILLCSCSSKKSNSSNHFDHTLTAQYKILELDSTPNYFILKTENNISKEKATIITEKSSTQIKDNKLEVYKNYSLSTYGIFDLVHIGNYKHNVEGIEVWNSNQLVDLRFTESMGNENDTIIAGKLVVNGKLKYEKK